MKQSTLFRAGIVVAIPLLIAITTVIQRNQNKRKAKLTIGILQTASHPALDAAREGFIMQMRDAIGDKVDFVIKNAQGDIAQAHMIAKQFHVNNAIKGIFAIATPATQAIAHIEKEKPIFIAAVTDPNSLGLITPTSNVCGSSDKIDIDKQIELIKLLKPEVKMVGMLFSIGEVNAVGLVNQMQQELENQSINVVKMGISNQTDIPNALQRATDVDLIWVPTDNAIAAAISFVAQKARELKKPLFVSDNLLVQEGALAAGGINYFDSGKAAAQCAIDVLIKHKKPFELPLAKPTIDHFVINQKLLSEFKLVVPDNNRHKIVFINKEG